MEFEQPTWGHVDPAALARIVVVSPHFDDAAMGAGQMLLEHSGRSQTTVITVFGGPPAAYPDPPSEWDALGGFTPGDDVVAIRRQEDRAAMEVLGAEPVWLDYVDHQYVEENDRARAREVAPVLEAALAACDPTAVFVPMGLGNPDHVVTHNASLLTYDKRREWVWFCYEDHGYKHLPGLLAWRVAKLLKSGRWPTPALVPAGTDRARKREAILCYRSQIPPLERDHGLTARLATGNPEQFWRIDPPPQGWEGLADIG